MTSTENGVHNIKSRAEFDEAIKDGSLAVFDMYATWCAPCKVVAPKIVRMSNQYPDAKFYKIDVDDLPDLSAELGVKAMPTFLIFKDGEKVGEVVGANDKAVEQAVVERLGA